MISIIIPHLNQEQQLFQCLESLQAQKSNHNKFEIIVIDNGSVQLPTKTIAKFKDIVLAEEATAGPGPARNKGVSLAKGNILAFIDADCIAHKNWLDTIGRALIEGNTFQIIGGDVRIARASPEKATILEAYESVFAYRQEEYIKRKGFSGTGNLAVRRRDFERIGPFKGIEVAEDREWGERANKKGYSITYLRHMIVYHPARRTFKDLFRKWDRHISHDFETFTSVRAGRFRWALYSFGVGISPAFEIVNILRSPRITGFNERLAAIFGMTWIRLYRFRRMIGVLWANDAKSMSRNWNRNG